MASAFSHIAVPAVLYASFKSDTMNFKLFVLELTYNWVKQHYDLGRAFGHVALVTDDIYETCEALVTEGINIIRMPRPMKDDAAILIALLEDQESYKVELIQLQKTIPCKD